MSISAGERNRIRELVLSKACSEYRRNLPCIERHPTPMVGERHRGCVEVDEVLEIVGRIEVTPPPPQ